ASGRGLTLYPAQDEAIIEIEAVEEGTILKLLVAEGTSAIKVNAPIAMLEQGTGGVGRPAVAGAAPAVSPAAATRVAPEAGPRLAGQVAAAAAPTAM
ncbi:hypothetical protein, partial [Acinetobacter sp. LH3_13]|uniref:hypothetical protein n=1 Tax=Acinetobacter sp. LH3_13 TaxID=3434463 RepID=UPI003EB72DC6